MSNVDNISNQTIFGLNHIDMLRLDLLDDDISGNKSFKLKYNLEAAKSKNFKTLLTFGGAFSNHILATAKAAKLSGFDSIGVIRGQEADLHNPTLQRALGFGMKLIPVTREEYSEKSNIDYVKFLSNKFNAFVIPEGGSNYLGVNGAAEIWQSINSNYDQVFVAAGTGSTAAGLILGNKGGAKIQVIQALKGDFMTNEIMTQINWVINDRILSQKLLSEHTIHTNFHCGGYGKWNEELIAFIQQFYKQFKIKLDPIYTGKVALACSKLIITKESQRVLIIHTGGVQGVKGFTQKTGVELY